MTAISLAQSVRIWTLAVALWLTTTLTQAVWAQSAFDRFDGDDDITAIVVSKKMFSLMGKMNPKDKTDQKFVNLIKKLDHLKVFVTSNAKKRQELKAVAQQYIKTAHLEELMRISEKNQQVRIMIRSGQNDDQVKELLMLIEGSGKEESVLLSLSGLFDLNELSLLTDKMNLPGGDSLKKAAKRS